MAKKVECVSARRLELASLNPEYPGWALDLKDVARIARILWASQ